MKADCVTPWRPPDGAPPVPAAHLVGAVRAVDLAVADVGNVHAAELVGTLVLLVRALDGRTSHGLGLQGAGVGLGAVVVVAVLPPGLGGVVPPGSSALLASAGGTGAAWGRVSVNGVICYIGKLDAK